MTLIESITIVLLALFMAVYYTRLFRKDRRLKNGIVESCHAADDATRGTLVSDSPK